MTGKSYASNSGSHTSSYARKNSNSLDHGNSNVRLPSADSSLRLYNPSEEDESSRSLRTPHQHPLRQPQPIQIHQAAGLLPKLEIPMQEHEIPPTFTFGQGTITTSAFSPGPFHDPILELLVRYSALTPYPRQVLLQLPLPSLKITPLPVPPLQAIRANQTHYVYFPTAYIPLYIEPPTEPPHPAAASNPN